MNSIRATKKKKKKRANTKYLCPNHALFPKKKYYNSAAKSNIFDQTQTQTQTQTHIYIPTFLL